MRIPMNKILNKINNNFIRIGDPKYHLCLFSSGHFSKYSLLGAARRGAPGGGGARRGASWGGAARRGAPWGGAPVEGPRGGGAPAEGPGGRGERRGGPRNGFTYK